MPLPSLAQSLSVPLRLAALGIVQASLPLLSLKRIILIGCQQAVLLVPLELLLTCPVVFLVVFLYTRGGDVDQVSIEVVSVLVSVIDVRAVRRSFFRAVVDVTDTGQLELMPRRALIGVGEVIACIEGTVELHVTLREVLLLACDSMHVVVAHGKGVRCRLIVRSLVSTC